VIISTPQQLSKIVEGLTENWLVSSHGVFGHANSDLGFFRHFQAKNVLKWNMSYSENDTSSDQTSLESFG